ncbi:helix-turn-helix domain-containing protein [Lactococcus lactis subsp. lactis]|uniref:dynamin family protein n=2 Tax=Lactococcus TaxID=1357 RepID=UPI0018AB368B|nr:dynamin family protein [Lactococcus lactis]MCT0055336.1 helix-turn-helix domain-containing protein [Lactococcus lactis subsp. lactis]
MALELSDLRQLRERLNISQQEIADRLGTTKTTISNWEAAPDKLSLDKLQQYLEVVGATISDFDSTNTSKGNMMTIKVNKEMMKFRSDLTLALKKLSNSATDITKNKKKTKSFETIYTSTMSDLKKLQLQSRKMRVLIVGPSDAGKSTFINAMLGEQVLPAHWTPATSCAIKILHSSEKPEWMTGNTIIVKNILSVDKTPTESWDLRDKEYFDNHVQVEGGREIVADYGEREGNNYNKDLVSEDIIFTYVDSEILNSIEIWDTPGTSAGADEESEIDEQLSTDARNNADAVIYLMQANSFMHKQDFQLLRRDIEKLPQCFNEKLGKFSNLFVLASQADIIESEAERNYILQKGAERFSKSLGENFFKTNGGNEEKLAERFFALSTKPGKEKISEKFKTDFTSFIENAEQLNFESSCIKRNKIVRFHLSEFKSSEDKINAEKNNHESIITEYKERKTNLKQVIKGNEEIRNKFAQMIENSRKTAKKNFKTFYSKQINATNLRSLLDNGGYTKSADDREIFANKVSNILSDEYQNILNKESEEFKNKYTEVINSVQIKTGISKSIFDYEGAVSGLIASGVTAGVFATIAATITSNLGLYILVAQIGGLLTSIGIISSPIVAVTAVSALGGPVGWVIGISIAVGLLVGTFVGLINKNAWKDKFIKQIISEYEKQFVLNQYIEGINAFMNESIEASDKILEGSNLAAAEAVKDAEARANATDEDFNLEIEQVGKWSKKFKEALGED